MKARYFIGSMLLVVAGFRMVAVSQDDPLGEDQSKKQILKRLTELESRVEEMQTMLYATRYVIDVPVEADGQLLSIRTISNGESSSTGGATVVGGEKAILYLRRQVASDELDVCWMQKGVGTANYIRVADPTVRQKNRTFNSGRELKSGDWLLKGDDEPISSTGSARYGLQIQFEKL